MPDVLAALKLNYYKKRLIPFQRVGSIFFKRGYYEKETIY